MKKAASQRSLYEVEGIGTVRVVRNRASRTVSLSISSHGLRVTCPRWVPLRDVLGFVRQRKPWIEEQAESIARKGAGLLERGINYDAIDPREARLLLVTRLRDLAKLHDFSWRRISIRNQRARWGSCSVKGDISLNRKLAALPEELRDYVILHELLHTRIRDHSSHFWDELALLVEDYRRLRAELRQYGPF